MTHLQRTVPAPPLDSDDRGPSERERLRRTVMDRPKQHKSPSARLYPRKVDVIREDGEMGGGDYHQPYRFRKLEDSILFYFSRIMIGLVINLCSSSYVRRCKVDSCN